MPPMLFFDNLVKKIDNYHCKPTSNIDIYPSTLETCINNVKNFFSFDLDHPPTPKPYQRPPHSPENYSSAQYFQQKPTYLLTVNVWVIFQYK